MAINLRQPLSDWKQRLSDGFDTRLVRLRVFEEPDRPFAHGILNAQAVYTFIKDLENKEQGQAWFDHVLGKRNHLFFTMKTTHDGNRAGLIIFHEQPDASLSLGAVIDPSLRNRGYTSDFLTGLKTFLSSIRFPYPVTADVHENHAHARHLLEKAGWHLSEKPPSGNRVLYRLTI